MLILVAGLLAFSNIVYVALNPQAPAGVVSGSVMNDSRAPIPNARVTLVNTATGVARSIATDDTGFYTAAGLMPGDYEMTAGSEGFTTQVRSGIVLDVGASLVFNVVMQAGDPARVVRMTVSGTLTGQGSSAVGGNVNTSTVV